MSGEPDAIVSDEAGAAGRVADAAAERRQVRAARHRNAERTSMRDVLVGVAEQSATVSLVVGNGRSHRALVVGVGADVVVAVAASAGTEAGVTLLIGLDALRTVVTHGAASTTARSGWVDPESSGGDRPRAGAWSHGLHMGEILAQRLDERPRITAWVGQDKISGTLMSVGLDVAAIATEGSGETAYVRLDSTTEISVSVPSSV